MSFRPTVSRLVPVAGALYLALAGSSVASPCSDRIDALQARVDKAGDTTAALSTGGQGVAAARQGQAMQAENQVAPITPATVPPFQAKAAETEATRDAADTGGGGDGVIQALATLNEAKTLDERGDSAACLEMVTAAETQLGTP